MDFLSLILSISCGARMAKHEKWMQESCIKQIIFRIGISSRWDSHIANEKRIKNSLFVCVRYPAPCFSLSLAPTRPHNLGCPLFRIPFRFYVFDHIRLFCLCRQSETDPTENMLDACKFCSRVLFLLLSARSFLLWSSFLGGFLSIIAHHPSSS